MENPLSRSDKNTIRKEIEACRVRIESAEAHLAGADPASQKELESTLEASRRELAELQQELEKNHPQ